MPLKEEKEAEETDERGSTKQEMRSREEEGRVREGPPREEQMRRNNSQRMNSTAKGNSQPSEREEKRRDEGRKSAMDVLFKQFPQRNSFTVDDSKVKRWKREATLGKRGAEESREVDTGLITDLKGLHKHEQKVRRQRQSKKKFISEYFGETRAARRANFKRCIQFWG